MIENKCPLFLCNLFNQNSDVTAPPLLQESYHDKLLSHAIVILPAHMANMYGPFTQTYIQYCNGWHIAFYRVANTTLPVYKLL